jgi:hypothetical protein
MRIRMNFGKALAAMAILCVPVWLGGRASMSAQTSRPAGGDRATFVGTYRLMFTEIKDDKGQWTRTPNFNSVGYITYADTGHMAVHIMPRNRPRFASNQNQPTGEEALAAIRGYTAYFGPFTVDESKKIVTHHRVGTIRPGQPAPFLRYYEFTGDRLTLTPVPANNGSREQATNRLVWERLPNAPLSAEEKKFLGFHKLLYTDSYRMKDGKEIFHGDRVETRANTSWIIYTPTGHMMVHLMDNKGRAEYAGAQATPAEALAAYRTYSGYFGRFTTYENYNPPFVLHNQQGTLRPGGENDATKRFYQFKGNILRLGTPPTVNAAGETAGGHLYWETMPPARN